MAYQESSYQQFKIEPRNSIPYRPQMNGAVEALNVDDRYL